MCHGKLGPPANPKSPICYSTPRNNTFRLPTISIYLSGCFHIHDPGTWFPSKLHGASASLFAHFVHYMWLFPRLPRWISTRGVLEGPTRMPIKIARPKNRLSKSLIVGKHHVPTLGTLDTIGTEIHNAKWEQYFSLHDLHRWSLITLEPSMQSIPP